MAEEEPDVKTNTEIAAEEKKKEEETKEEVKPDPAPSDLIDKANAAAARMEQANAERKNLISKEEALKVKETLGGKGASTNENKEDSPKEYAKKVMANDVGTRQ